MKIAIATEGSAVAPHFGRCPEYTIYNVKDGSVSDKTVIPNPGHEPGFLPEYLSELGVSCIIAGGMGMRAQNLFAAKNIQTVVGVTGLVDDVAKSFAAGALKGGESLCEHGESERRMNHNCGHHGDLGDGHECEKK
ncbi:MAG: dinitrogenase iron-molybdenum cofactor [Firmicutes bacterium]|jgi:predicted Fe-Mo cluster-binding NifX family protein|nr:dinitrogenase iron-molybdenum cofactor [Bacillota bacterium]